MKAIEEKGKLCVYMTGKIDSSNAPAVERELADALSAHPGLEPVLDAEGLEFISSAGLRAFKRTYMDLHRKGGVLSAKNASKSLMEVFELTGFARLFKFV